MAGAAFCRAAWDEATTRRCPALRGSPPGYRTRPAARSALPPGSCGVPIVSEPRRCDQSRCFGTPGRSDAKFRSRFTFLILGGLSCEMLRTQHPDRPVQDSRRCWVGTEGLQPAELPALPILMAGSAFIRKSVVLTPVLYDLRTASQVVAQMHVLSCTRVHKPARGALLPSPIPIDTPTGFRPELCYRTPGSLVTYLLVC